MFDLNFLIENILTLKENHRIEFKKANASLPRSFWETYSSFSNTDGGVIILGVEESEPDNTICGVNNPEKLVSDLWNLLSNRNKVSYNTLTNSDISIKTIVGNTSIIIVNVKEAPLSKKPIFIDNDISKAYTRTGDGDRLISEEEVKIIARNASPQVDSIPLDRFSLDDLDPISIASFKEKVTARYPDKGYENLNHENFLIELGVLRKDRTSKSINPTRGALLFLGKYNSIRDVYPSFHMDYFNRKGNNERWIDRVATDEPGEYQMNIYNFYNIVKEKLYSATLSSFKLGDENIRAENRRISEAIRESFNLLLIQLHTPTMT